MSLSIGSSTGGINPISGSKLYWAVAVPKLLYGCEVWSMSIESDIDIKRLCYVHRLICDEPRSIARKLTVHVFIQMYIDKDISTYEGPIAVLYKTCKKYNLMDIVYN